MTYNSWVDAPPSGSFRVISDRNNNKSTGKTIEYCNLEIHRDIKFARTSPRDIWFHIKDVIFPKIINNKKLNKIIHEL